MENNEKNTRTPWKKIALVGVAVFAIIVILAAAVFSVAAYMTVEKNSEIIATATLMTDEEAISDGNEEAENTTVNLASSDAEINFTFHDNAFFVSAGKIPLTAADGTGMVVQLPDGEYTVEYDKAEGYLKVETEAGEIYVTVSDKTEANSSSLYVFQTEEEQKVVAGRIAVGNNALFLYGTPSSEETVDGLETSMAQIADNVCEYSGNLTVTINGYTVNPEWTENITASGEFAAFSNGSESVNISAYEFTTEGAGFTNKVSVEGVGDFLYGSYQDAESGLRPYIHSSETGMMKIMASGEESLNAFFSMPAADPVPAESETASAPQGNEAA